MAANRQKVCFKVKYTHPHRMRHLTLIGSLLFLSIWNKLITDNLWLLEMNVMSQLASTQRKIGWQKVANLSSLWETVELSKPF